tara:strand:+ start:1333 stop:1722 length:390 start_codon:yes stop_codon:yes gene_type:complete
MKKILIIMFIVSNLLAEPRVYFIEPKDNEILTEREVTVKFGLEDFGVAPAGYNIPNTGHHHLIIDSFLPEDLTKPIPADEYHLHFGLGQTETVITLEPGQHTLRLVLGNYLHIPHQEPLYSEEITVLVL